MTKKIIVKVSDYGIVVLYSNLKLFCEMEGVNYHSYKDKKFPFYYESDSLLDPTVKRKWEIHKLEIWFNKKK